MTTRWLVYGLGLSIALITKLAMASASDNNEGFWMHTKWWCPEVNVCTAQDVRTGVATRISEDIHLWSRNSRICGFWSYHGAMHDYTNLIAGTHIGNFFLMSVGQEIESNPLFYEAKSFAEVPPFEVKLYISLRKNGSRLVEYQCRLSDIPGERSSCIFSDSLNKEEKGKQRNLSNWESEFIDTCLAGTNTSIERARNSALQLRNSRVNK